MNIDIKLCYSLSRQITNHLTIDIWPETEEMFTLFKFPESDCFGFKDPPLFKGTYRGRFKRPGVLQKHYITNVAE